MSGQLVIHPKRLAEALDSAVHFTKEKKPSGTIDRVDINDTVWIRWDGEVVDVRGRCSYSACIHTIEVYRADAEPWTIIIDVEDAIALSKALKKADGANAADTESMMTVIDEDEILLSQGNTQFGSFLQVEEEEEGEFEHLWGNLDWIRDQPRHETPPTAPLAWTRIVLEKLLKIRVGDTHRAWDRFEVHWIGGATWTCRVASEDGRSVFTGLLESTRDNLEVLS